MIEEERQQRDFIPLTLTRVLGKARPDADLQGFAGRLQNRHISLTLNKQDLPRAAPAQEAPVLLLQLHLQSEQQHDGVRERRGRRRRRSHPPPPPVSTDPRQQAWCPHSRVVKLERQLPLRFLLEAASQQADELRFEDALQQAVVLLLVQDHEVVLHRTEKNNGSLEEGGR